MSHYLSRADVIAELRTRVAEAGSASAFVQSLGAKPPITASYVYRVLSGATTPGPGILQALRLRRCPDRYERAPSQ